MKRRAFMQACALGTGSALARQVLGEQALTPKRYEPARLSLPDGSALKASRLVAHRAYLFHYPYAGTPCFLLNLGEPTRASTELRTADARTYRWQGGVGPKQSIVAYSAICSHRMTYPTREISFIGYREHTTPHSKHARVIHCCSEHSQYDVAAGGKVLTGPAPQPLAAVILEYDSANDALIATGTLGGELFNDFFAKFEMKLALEHSGKARAAVGSHAVVQELTAYCKQQVRC